MEHPHLARRHPQDDPFPPPGHGQAERDGHLGPELPLFEPLGEQSGTGDLQVVEAEDLQERDRPTRKVRLTAVPTPRGSSASTYAFEWRRPPGSGAGRAWTTIHSGESRTYDFKPKIVGVFQLRVRGGGRTSDPVSLTVNFPDVHQIIKDEYVQREDQSSGSSAWTSGQLPKTTFMNGASGGGSTPGPGSTCTPRPSRRWRSQASRTPVCCPIGRPTIRRTYRRSPRGRPGGSRSSTRTRRGRDGRSARAMRTSSGPVRRERRGF